jgi:hypothetical protein
MKVEQAVGRLRKGRGAAQLPTCRGPHRGERRGGNINTHDVVILRDLRHSFPFRQRTRFHEAHLVVHSQRHGVMHG